MCSEKLKWVGTANLEYNYILHQTQIRNVSLFLHKCVNPPRSRMVTNNCISLLTQMKTGQKNEKREKIWHGHYYY